MKMSKMERMKSMSLPEFVTIGVYGWDEDDFFRALVAAGVDTFCDLRARRGVRGPDYAFANSERLQTRLAELGIRYLHRRTWRQAPRHGRDNTKPMPPHMCPAQADQPQLRVHAEYRARMLYAGFDRAAFLAELGPGAHVVALFCVEREPSACHRSLLPHILPTIWA